LFIYNIFVVGGGRCQIAKSLRESAKRLRASQAAERRHAEVARGIGRDPVEVQVCAAQQLLEELQVRVVGVGAALSHRWMISIRILIRLFHFLDFY
jgi:hypothetical protein